MAAEMRRAMVDSRVVDMVEREDKAADMAVKVCHPISIFSATISIQHKLTSSHRKKRRPPRWSRRARRSIRWRKL